MSVFLCYIAWEWINIALEYTVTSWVKLPRWFLAVVGVNLTTHPVFVFMLERFGRVPSFILFCEAIIVLLEALLLMCLYGFNRWRRLFAIAFLMNATSYVTGVLI